ncbi:UDP-galactose transporter [Spizellomyces punctatus DAOM BR117]|uniref:GDP-mannose transporter n=1 Tax=Spizellomyces punctatus (strain DAOM BR117) TaxID=645134 RepID=A0A0L0HJN5_SPIPD|nr:UDP-galactose transporter [Spizellomyces punctatus DAOM BR117]KND01080.1 UDP-galactose transporter [Spizellomyces punctatus DAOM BR117]|eukprot:XP_016609119.1 UDP-galactose transporter [Spizellomyces punctatus DAOM BR117]
MTSQNTAVTAITSYCLSSILMTLTNKLVLSSYDFKLNFLLLAIQSVICVITLEIFGGLGLVSRRRFSWDDGKKWFIVSASLVAMIYTGSKALQHLSIPLFTIFKNLTIILIAYSERTLLKGPPVTRLMLVAFLMMVVSSIIAGWADLSTGKVLKPTDSDSDMEWIVAYGWMLSNCLTTAGFALLMKSKIREVGFKEFDTVFYNNLLSIPILVVACLLLEGGEAQKFYEKYSDPERPSGEVYGLAIGILMSGVSSFGISYSTAWCMRVTSSTTYSMVGALNKLPIAVAGMIFFNDPVTFGGVAGVLIAFFAGIVYSHAKSVQPTAGVKPASDLPLPVNIKADRDRGLYKLANA